MQTDGTPIGKLISGPLVDFYMDWFEQAYIYSEHTEFKNHLKVWKRIRDYVIFYVVVDRKHETVSSVE